MIPAAPLPMQPRRWQQAWREAVRDPRELLALLGLRELAQDVSDAAAAQFPLRVPRAFVARMRHGDPSDPLLRQVLPLDAEMRPVPGFGLDAVGDGAAKAGQGVIHKYQGRALLVATGSCAVHCRFSCWLQTHGMTVHCSCSDLQQVLQHQDFWMLCRFPDFYVQ